MSPLSASFGARKRDEDQAPPAPPADEVEALREEIFRLIPARAETFRNALAATDASAAATLAGNLRHADVAKAEPPVLPEAKAEVEKAEVEFVAPPARPDPKPHDEPKPAPAVQNEPQGRNVRPPQGIDLTRLSIDNDGRLYWDGKPVEVRRRILMSRAQVLAAGLIGSLIFIVAAGVAVQGSVAAYDWACRTGFSGAYCAAPALPSAPHVRHDIPT